MTEHDDKSPTEVASRPPQVKSGKRRQGRRPSQPANDIGHEIPAAIQAQRSPPDDAAAGSTAKAWLEQELPKHLRLTAIAASLVESLLQGEGIEYLNVTHRTKDRDGCMEKIKRKEYTDPATQLTDISGIRVVTYLEDQTHQVAEILLRAFTIDFENSSNRRIALGSDRVGYRSLHFVCSLGEQRSSLPEYEGLGELLFEVQIRTVLQHAWAELAHDNSFKFDAVLPVEMQRKLNLHAAMLEIADNAFQEIQTEIRQYSTSIETEKLLESPDASINTLVAEKIMSDFSEDYSIATPEDIHRGVLEEAIALGIDTVGKYRSLFSEQFFHAVLRHKGAAVTKSAMVRLLLLYNHFEEYCKNHKSWGYMTPSTYALISERYGADTDAILSNNEIEIKSLDQVHAENVARREEALANWERSRSENPEESES